MARVVSEWPRGRDDAAHHAFVPALDRLTLGFAHLALLDDRELKRSTADLAEAVAEHYAPSGRTDTTTARLKEARTNFQAAVYLAVKR
jgi:hypothetical protein